MMWWDTRKLTEPTEVLQVRDLPACSSALSFRLSQIPEPSPAHSPLLHESHCTPFPVFLTDTTAK